MKNILNDVLNRIGADFRENIREDSRYYLEISIGRKAAELGHPEVEADYHNVYAMVPLKHPVAGMKVRIDGRTFVNYAQFDSGIVVPHYVARQVDLPHRPYIAKGSMVCNFG